MKRLTTPTIVVSLPSVVWNVKISKRQRQETLKQLSYITGETISTQNSLLSRIRNGYKVIYETFDSNEAMLTKIKQRWNESSDIAIPSEVHHQQNGKKTLIENWILKIKGMENI